MPQGVEHGVRDVGGGQLVRGPGEHARDVERDVAGPDDGDGRGVQQRRRDVVRVAAVPAHDRPGADAAGQVLTGDAQAPVDGAADGVHDRGVVLAQRGERDAALADPHAADEAHLAGAERPAQHPDDRLHLHVVGRDPVAHEPVRRRQPVEHVDVDGGLRGHERRGRVQPGRPGAHHRHPGTSARHAASSPSQAVPAPSAGPILPRPRSCPRTADQVERARVRRSPPPRRAGRAPRGTCAGSRPGRRRRLAEVVAQQRGRAESAALATWSMPRSVSSSSRWAQQDPLQRQPFAGSCRSRRRTGGRSALGHARPRGRGRRPRARWSRFSTIHASSGGAGCPWRTSGSAAR